MLSLYKNNKNLLVVSLVAVVNALGYGIIIPVLYSYSQKFGLTDFHQGLLFAVFSICQFVSTPIIGRLSDKYGRRPLLTISVAGTAVSFFMMAFAPNVFFLFLARVLDGITAGNFPVASAVITDTTVEKDRAKGFGIIGASFGFGFIFGPAISALTVGYSAALPFIVAGIITVIATLIAIVLLEETNKHIGEVKHGKLFDFKKMYHALFDPNVGVTFLITLFYFLAFSLFIYAFQPYAVKILKLSANQISVLFTVFGVIGLLGQVFLVHKLESKFGIKKTFSFALLTVAASFFMIFFAHSFVLFVAISALLGLANSLIQPLISTVISKETDVKSQGSMLGLNASYMSIGQIVGPILGGALATISIPFPFLGGALITFLCYILSFKILRPGVKKESLF